MILTRTPSTTKQRTEFRLLVSIRFASLMASEPNPMDNQRVQKRLAELNHYLQYNQPTQLFYRQYCRQAGELGSCFSIKVCPQTLQVQVWRHAKINLYQLVNA